MHDELIRRLNETKTMSIVGMCKNAGKTTMLNWLLTQGHLQGTLGLTSIGRDGESTDIVTGTSIEMKKAKPSFSMRSVSKHTSRITIIQIARIVARLIPVIVP